MHETMIPVIALPAFGLQLLFCMVFQRRLVRLIPTLFLVAAIAGCVAGYALSQWTNWGFLILEVLFLAPLAAAGAAWLAAVRLKALLRARKGE